MKTYFYFFFLLFATSATFAQNAGLGYLQSFGDSSYEYGYDLAVDDSGYVYTTGHFGGTGDFDPSVNVFNQTSLGSGDVYVQKTDSAGNFVWAISIGGTGSQVAHAITIDLDGNLYVAGSFFGLTDFDPGLNTFSLTPAGQWDCFLVKLTPNGNFIWAKAVGGTSADEATDVVTGPSGAVYLSGYYQGTGDFDPGAGIFNLTSAGNYDGFIQKLDSNGNFIWAKSVSGTQDEWGACMATDLFGNVYLGGTFTGVTDFNPSAGVFNINPGGDPHGYVLKLDGNGNFVWAKEIEAVITASVTALLTNSAGDVILMGFYRGIIDHDPSGGVSNSTAVGYYDVFVQQLDANGNLDWAKSFGGINRDLGWNMTIDDAGSIYMAGEFVFTVDFDPGPGVYNLTATDGIDAFFLKLSALGTFEWAKAVGGDDNEVGNGVGVGPTGALYGCGSYEVHALLNPPVSNSEVFAVDMSDVFVLQLVPCAIDTFVDQITACDSYTWVDGITYTANNNAAMFTLASSNGCDSVVALDLTLSTLNLSVASTDTTLTANAVGATYQWLDCDANYLPLNGYTNQTFNAPFNGNYAVEITGGCVDTSACFALTTVGLPEEETRQVPKIYPNPTNNHFTVQFDRPIVNATLSILDVAGKAVRAEEQVSGTSVTVTDLKLLPGIYFVQIENGVERYLVRLMIHQTE